MSNSLTTPIRGSVRDMAIGKTKTTEKADRATVRRTATKPSTSQPLQHALDRPWKLRSEVPTKAPAVSPPPPVRVRVKMSKNPPKLVPPPPVPVRVSMSKNAPKLVPTPPVPVQVSMSKNAPKLVPPPPVPPLGSISARPRLIPGYGEDKQRETKLKLAPLSRLTPGKKTHTSTSGSSSQMHEKLKKEFTDGIKS
ncbi:hypothetical protein CQW23_33896 [Capsicum baccatum]|uniref:Uncharacterized protein n=1 Tax=Capsicum baccatum TaxID=33114 RepID=A0A2G2V0J1_CAPBA|nr:hypothetical protein CQW23_33896 [Capsicum baccatum]